MRFLRAAVACALAAATFAVPATAAPKPVVTGRVLDGAGRPVAGATVTIGTKSDAFGFPLLLACVFSLGLLPDCHTWTATGRTDRNGRYAVKIDNGTLVGRTGPKSLTIREPGTRTLPGAVTTTEVYWARQNLRVVDLRVWHAKPAVERVGPMVRVRREPLPAAYGSPKDDVPDVVLLQEAAAVWQYADAEDDHYSDVRTVEAGTTGAREVATASLPHGYHVTYLSRAVPVPAGTKPVSRGAACAVYGPNDTLLPLAGCKYTDGRLADSLDVRYVTSNYKACRFPTASCPHPMWVRFDLGSPQAIQAALVRGCSVDETSLGTFPAEVSVDGTVWAPFHATNPYSDLEYGPPTPARYVRVDLRGCGSFGATEVSIFGLPA